MQIKQTQRVKKQKISLHREQALKGDRVKRDPKGDRDPIGSKSCFEHYF